MTCAAPCICDEQRHAEIQIEGRAFVCCGACDALTPLPRGARVDDEARFYDALEQLPTDEILAEYEADQRRVEIEINACRWTLLGVACVAAPWVVFALCVALFNR